MKDLMLFLLGVLWIAATVVLTLSIVGWVIVVAYDDEWFEIPNKLISKLG